jgi:hypothetical protein
MVSRALKQLRLDLPMGELKLGRSSGRRRSVGHLPRLVSAHLLPELVEIFGCQWLMAGLGNNPVQVLSTGRANHWEFLRLWTGFELPSSCVDLP